FAKKYGIAVGEVVSPRENGHAATPHDGMGGILHDSGPFSGREVWEVVPEVIDWIEKEGIGKRFVNYHLHDWSVSRQRYWGTPVPMIHCDIDGIIPVPEKDLPVTLPYDVDYQPKGKPPLASNEEWMRVKCPKCGKDAKRDPETLDTFFDSSWYYYRYVDPKFGGGPFDPKEVAKLMPLDIYFGGGEHTLGHTLYARFFTKFFKDLGMVNFSEFALKRIQHGIVLGPDGNKMSKSKGNVINPDDVVKEFGTDAVRVYLSFMMPYNTTGPWSTSAMYGMFKFLKRVWDLQYKVDGKEKNDKPSTINHELSPKDLFYMNTTIKKVEEDIASTKFNTAVAEIMKWLNHLESKESISEKEFKTLLLILAPFAPHVTEELWQLDKVSGSNEGEVDFKSIHQEAWPVIDESMLTADEVTMVIQVNGKLRASINVGNKTAASQEEIEKLALENDKVKLWTEGKEILKKIFVPKKLINFVVR
ncbi:MAG TPA: class I tRNA ligase family protein, partial [Patescibacteria group bacterium]